MTKTRGEISRKEIMGPGRWLLAFAAGFASANKVFRFATKLLFVDNFLSHVSALGVPDVHFVAAHSLGLALLLK